MISSAMRCPRCKSKKIFVIETRKAPNNRIRRRRCCEECEARFTTYEYIPMYAYTRNKLKF